MLQKNCFLKCQLIAKWLQLLSSDFIFATMKTSATEWKILLYPSSLFPARKCKNQTLLHNAATFDIRASSLSLAPLASLGQTDRPTNQNPWDVQQDSAMPWLSPGVTWTFQKECCQKNYHKHALKHSWTSKGVLKGKAL